MYLAAIDAGRLDSVALLGSLNHPPYAQAHKKCKEKKTSKPDLGSFSLDWPLTEFPEMYYVRIGEVER